MFFFNECVTQKKKKITKGPETRRLQRTVKNIYVGM